MQEIQKRDRDIISSVSQRIRLDAALALYNSDHYSLLDCALQAGFTSEKVMIDWCRKIYQCTPAQYKIQKKLTGLYR